MPTFDGNDNNNFLNGSDQADLIRGFGGMDTLRGRLGADILDGGTNTDRAMYDDSDVGVTVFLVGGPNGSGFGLGGTAEGDQLISIESITGSLHADGLVGNELDNFIDGGGGVDTLKGGGGDDDLRGGGSLEGGTGDDALRGFFGDDTLHGEADDDRLDGRGGADVLDGGAGIDQAVYDASTVGVQIILSDTGAGGGAFGDAQGDTLFNVENLTGSSYADHFIANAAANELRGLQGNDVLKGLGGADTLIGDIGDDTLEGGDGNDRLIGGFDADQLTGGAGIDVADYFDSNAGVVVSLDGALTSSGGHAAGDTFAGVEDVDGSEFADMLDGDGGRNELFGGQGKDTLKGGGGDDVLLGSFDDDRLFGGDGADVLSGGDGADDMIGNAGNDTYVFDTSGDTINEILGSGIDTVQSRVSFSLLGSAVMGDVENITLTGTANVNATGNALANTLTGNSGANRLNGGAGADRMAGGGGNDRYTVDSAGDVVDEGTPGASGIEEVGTTISFSLSGAQVKGTAENLLLLGNASINGAGNGVANSMVGNSGANQLMGLGGNDTLRGGGGADTFVFNAPLNAVTNVDAITDYNVAQDTMRLENAFMTALATGPLAAGAFHVGSAAHDASDRIVYNAENGDLSYDADGTGATAAIRFADLVPGLALTSAEFLIV